MSTSQTTVTQPTESDCFICDELAKEKQYRAIILHKMFYHEGDDND
jgi:hypothetical protein